MAKVVLSLTAFMAKHHTPFELSDHSVKTIKAAFPDSAIAKKITSNKTKSSHGMPHGTAWKERADLHLPQKNHFLLI